MKLILTILNVLLIFYSLYYSFKGESIDFQLLLTYGMALGAIYGRQKKYFYIIAIALNSIFLLMGLGFMVFQIIGNTAVTDINQELSLALKIFTAFIFVTSLNIYYIWKKLKT